MFNCCMYILYSYIVDCSGTSMTSAGTVIYTIPSPATQGTTMQVTCQSGYTWNMALYSGSQTATCVNESNTAQWSISQDASCVGKFNFYISVHIIK